jgi:hypothetical protein
MVHDAVSPTDLFLYLELLPGIKCVREGLVSMEGIVLTVVDEVAMVRPLVV